MARAGHGMGEKRGVEGAGAAEPGTLDESDLASDIMGNNRLQGNDQNDVRGRSPPQTEAGVHNERHAYPDERGDTDGIIESFEKLDKDVRAERDLGKGQGIHPGKGRDDAT